MKKDYDVLIIGGGITGAAILRDCAMRGVKAILFEKGEFGSQTTAASSALIHGGLRYLLEDIEETKICCREAGYLVRNLPVGLLKRQVFIMPFFKMPFFSKKRMEIMEIGFELYDRFSSWKDGRPHLNLTKQELLKLIPAINPEVVGGLTFDEYSVNPQKLVKIIIGSAVNFGGDAQQHFKIESFIIANDEIQGALLTDELTKKQVVVEAQYFINAAGPWSSQVAKLAGLEFKLRPTKGIHLVLAKAISPYGLAFDAIDGRHILAQSRDGKTLLGTTDDDYYGDLDNLQATEDEEEYLLGALDRVCPGKSKIIPIEKRIIGVRPTVFQWGKNEDKVSRGFVVVDHSKTDWIKNFITVSGGKMAAHRIMAQIATDLICQKMGINKICQTHFYPFLNKASPLQEISEKQVKKYWQKVYFPTNRKTITKVPLKDKISTFIFLALYLVKCLLKKLAGKKPGLEKFYENYRE